MSKDTPMIQLVLAGWLFKDPEFATTATGKQRVSFSIAYNTGKDPNRLTKWYNLQAFDDLAMFIAENYRKNSFVKVKCNRLNLWKNRTGSIMEGFIVTELLDEDLPQIEGEEYGPEGDTDGPPI